MVVVIKGKKPNGEPCPIYVDGYLQKNLDRVIDWVKNKNYDYVAIICGLPGVGKSNFAQNVARYCDTEFTEKNIAFSDDEFITITNNATE